MKKTQKKKTIIWRKAEFYFVLLLAILTLGLIAQMFYVNVVPLKFSIPFAIIFILIFIGMFILQFGKRINKVNKILGKILIIILSISLGIGNFYLFKTFSTFKKMTSDNSETSVVSIVVLNENKAKSINDLKNGKFGINKTGNQDSLSKSLDDIKKEVKPDLLIVEYKSYEVFGDDLYSGKIDAIILDEGTRGFFEDKHPKFSTETRVIKSYEYKKESTNISRGVNVTSDSFNVYITGIDTYGGISTVSRSDVNMVATINPKTHQILLTSIPRDYYVPQPCQGGQTDKLTHSGIFGVDCTVKTAEGFMGIDINYYARVNFSSLVKIVDAIGGIQVDNPQAFDSVAGISFSAGKITLNGEQALAFARERYAFNDGDRERGRNQMRVITGIINKLISPSIITNYSNVMDAVGGSFETNMGTNDITSLIKQQINDMSGWDIEQIAVNGQGNPSAWSPANGSNAWVMEPDKKTVENAVMLMKKVQAGEDVKPLVEAVNAENSVVE